MKTTKSAVFKRLLNSYYKVLNKLEVYQLMHEQGWGKKKAEEEVATWDNDEAKASWWEDWFQSDWPFKNIEDN